jgi:fumarate hydratase subunit beta
MGFERLQDLEVKVLGSYRLRTVLEEADVRQLRVGDVAYLSGAVFTMRDMAHLRALELLRRGEKLPFELKGGVIYHCGPLIKGDVVVSAGPTTSMRMERSEPDLIGLTGLRGIIGKGGMGNGTREALKKHGAVYLEYPGGAGALAARSAKRILGVYWKDLGEPEAVWVIEVADFGPCFVTMDSNGETLRKKGKA